jgi:hypothetical protein
MHHPSHSPLFDHPNIWQSIQIIKHLTCSYISVLDDQGSTVRFPLGAGNFSLHHRVQNGSGAHPASYPMGTRSSDKAAGA